MRVAACISRVAFFVTALGIRQEDKFSSATRKIKPLVAPYMAAALCKPSGKGVYPEWEKNQEQIQELCDDHKQATCCDAVQAAQSESGDVSSSGKKGGDVAAAYKEHVGEKDAGDGAVASIESTVDAVDADSEGVVEPAPEPIPGTKLIQSWYIAGATNQSPGAACLETCLNHWVAEGHPDEGKCERIRDVADCKSAKTQIRNLPKLVSDVLTEANTGDDVLHGSSNSGCMVVKLGSKQYRMVWVEGGDNRLNNVCGYYATK